MGTKQMRANSEKEKQFLERYLASKKDQLQCLEQLDSLDKDLANAPRFIKLFYKKLPRHYREKDRIRQDIKLIEKLIKRGNKNAKT